MIGHEAVSPGEIAVLNIHEPEMDDRAKILEMMRQDSLTAHFQPIFSIKEGKAFGFEALTRIKGVNLFSNIGELFLKAKETDVITLLDMKCRENAMKEAVLRGFGKTDAQLFINICPETLMDPAHCNGVTDKLAEEYGISKERIILEITEETAIHNYALFMKAVAYYKNAGYKIAIDDFGVGYGGLKMLSLIEPEFIKIDRHFISDIDSSLMKYNVADSIVTTCHRIGIRVIAEGLERKEEFEVMLGMGVDLVQGFYLGKPAPDFYHDTFPEEKLTARDFYKFRQKKDGTEAHSIGDIAGKAEIVSRDTRFKTLFDMFMNNAELRNLPVVEHERVIGMLQRVRFIENHVIGKSGYGIQLNAHKSAGNIMETNFLTVEANTPLEEISNKIRSRMAESLYDDICVTQNGKYFGLAAISSLIEAITRKSILLAKNANPLTGLPGNEVIQRELEKRITQNMHFDISYIDLNNFKPYNDHYGFERGDYVLKTLANILQEILSQFDSDPLNFIGHIGGDDFIMITRPSVSVKASEKIISDFETRQAELHGREDYAQGFYREKNRKGETEVFPLLSLAIGILSSDGNTLISYAQTASLSTGIKKLAKREAALTGISSIVKDRRG